MPISLTVVHRGIVQHGFAQLPCYSSFHMTMILLAFIFTFEGHFFGQLRKRSEVLSDVAAFFEILILYFQFILLFIYVSTWTYPHYKYH